MVAQPSPTPNIHLQPLLADTVNWTDTMNGNLKIVDAIVGAYFTVQNLQGIWLNSTTYEVGDTVIDSDTATLWQALVTHVSAAIPSTFKDERDAHSTYWGVYSTPARDRGIWAADTGYAINDFVTTGSYYAIAIQTHTSGADFLTDANAGKWSILIDLTAINAAIASLEGLNIEGPTISTANYALASNSSGSAIILKNQNDFSEIMRAASPSTYALRFNLALWGDSLTYGYGGEDVLGPFTPYPNQMYQYLGYRYFYNGGRTGETSTQIYTRYHAAPSKWNWRTVWWMGRNDIAAFGAGWSTTTIANIDLAIVDATSVGNTNYIIMGVTNSGAENNVSANYAAIVAHNAACATKYGSHFFDVRAYMCSTQPFTDLGLTASGTDLSEIAQGLIPTTFRRDATNVHFNSVGLQAIAYKLSQLVVAYDAAESDNLMSWHSAITGQTNNAIYSNLVTGNNVHAQSAFWLGDNILGNGSAQFIQGNPRQSMVMIGYNTQIPATIIPATTREWAFVGHNAGGTAFTGRAVSALGSDAGAVLTTGGFHVLIGTRAGTALTTGNSNTLIGVDSGAALTTQNENTAVGRYTLISSTSANPSTVMGFQVGFALTTGSMTGMGWKALRNVTTGNSNTAIGETAGGSLTTGGNNTYVGRNAGNANVSSNNQTAMGLSAALLATGTGGVFIGMQAGDNVTSADNVTVIGTNIDAISATQNNTLNISNYLFGTGMDGTGSTISAGRLGFGVKQPETELEFIGSMTFNPTTEPSNPSSGKAALYVDSGDSNKFKIKFSTGTKVTLGTP